MPELPIETTDSNYPTSWEEMDNYMPPKARSNEIWRDETPFNVDPIETPMTDSEKIEYVYQVALKVDAAVREVLPQVGPMLEGIQKNPMLKMFLR